MREFAMLGVTAVLLAGATTAMATEIDTKGASHCNFGAYATDHSPKGTDVRAAPRADAKVIGHLPPLYYVDKDNITGVEFRVIGSKDGWLLIRDAQDETTLKNLFEGAGWIPGSLAAVSAGDERLFAGPYPDAPIIVWLMDITRGWGADSFQITQIHACQGKMVEISVQPPDAHLKPRRGWITGTCTAQLSTCDYSYPNGVKRPEDYRYPDK